MNTTKPTHLAIKRALIGMMILMATASFVRSQVTSDDYFSKKGTAEPLTNTFFTVGTGINANFGLLGIGVEFPLTKKLTNETGLGLSAWGLKLNSELRLYFDENYEKRSIGVGFGWHSGGAQITQQLETDPQKLQEDVVMDYMSVSTINISLNRSWRLGKKRQHKILLQTGYVFRITDPYYKITSGHVLSPLSKRIMSVVAPGGITLGLAFNIGI